MLYLLIPLTAVLAFQDWRWQRVNLWAALLTIGVLAIGVGDVYLPLAVFGILWMYQRVRPGSIQIVDIVIFSLGAGYFTLPIFSVYCLVTAAVLFVLSKIKEGQLPFLVAWSIGFWAAFSLR